MKPGTRVKLALPLTYDQLDGLGIDKEAADAGGVEVWAAVTGEFRPVRAGEWFVSGAIPEAHQAVRDMHAVRLMDCRYIARLRWDGDDRDESDELLAAAKAVIKRWHSPLWKGVPATALYIQRLESAVENIEKTTK